MGQLENLVVRPYRASDREALEALWAQVFPDDPPRNAPALLIANKLAVQPELLLIAANGTAVAGAVMAGFDGVRGWIHHLAVAPAWRRRGVATQLVRAAEEGLRGLGCPKVNLQVRASNREVVAFYRSLGFEVEERVSMGRVLEKAAPAGDAGLGTWRPHEPAAAAVWLAGSAVGWWIAGGWALDLHVGGQSRAHHDLDVGVMRRDFARLREVLASWELYEAKGGVLTRLPAGAEPGLEVHSLWCRPQGERAWTLQLMLDDCAGEEWVYRRAPAITLPISALTRRSAGALAYLAPEVQLLYKARRTRPRDQADFELVAPLLDAPARGWLRRALELAEPGHAWIAAL